MEQRFGWRETWTFSLLVGLAALCGSDVTADEVYLRNGGCVRGEVVQRTPQKVTIETGPGLVTLSMERIERIVEGRSLLAEWRERAQELSPRDLEGWAALARWAAERDLSTQARESWLHVLTIDPSHPEANAALGRTQLNGRWMSSDDANRARGLVPFEGRWVSPAEHEALLRERLADEAASSARQEAESRVREAEARAREAEARASEAKAGAASGGQEADGIPIWWAGGGAPYVPQPFVPHPDRHPRCCSPTPVGPVRPVVSPPMPPATLGPVSPPHPTESRPVAPHRSPSSSR